MRKMIDLALIIVISSVAGILTGHGSTALIEEPTSIRGKVVPGIYWEDPQVQVATYEKVVPLVFEFRLRSDLWNNLPVGFAKFKLLPRLYCRTDIRASAVSTIDWFFTCPIFRHLNDFVQQYKMNYTDIHPTSRTLNRQDFQRFSHSPIRFEDCEQIISRSWKGINSRDVGLLEYKSLIEKQCNTMPSYFEEQIPDYANDVSYLFDTMKDNFASYFFVNSSNHDQGEMINALLNIQNLLLHNVISELTRFREAVLSCQNQLIPQSFLQASRLEKALSEIKFKLNPLKYTLTTSNIAKLYKMPIADCIFGTSTLTLQILLPVVRADVNFSLLRFTYPNFLYKDQLCRVKSHDQMRWDTESENFLYDRNSKTLLGTECLPNDRDLCYIPDLSQRPLVNKCIYEMLNASSEGIRKECSLACQTLSPAYKKLVLPIIKRVSSSKFIITLDRITTMLIKCEGKPDELISPQEFGAVEITLPCNCYVMYHAEKFYSRSPCGYNLVLAHVIPEHMVNSSVLKEPKVSARPNDIINSSLIPDEIVELIDLSGKEVEEVKNDSMGGVAYFSHEEQHKYISTSNSYESCIRNYTYLWVFVALQTLAFVGIVCMMYYKLSMVDKKCEYGRSAVCFSVSQMTNLDDKSS